MYVVFYVVRRAARVTTPNSTKEAPLTFGETEINDTYVNESK